MCDFHGMDLTEILARPEHAMAMVASMAIIEAVKGSFPSIKSDQSIARVMPLVPVVLCSIAVWLPGVTEAQPWGSRVLVGLVLGFASGHVYRMFKSLLKGRK